MNGRSRKFDLTKRLAELAIAITIATLSLFGTVKVELHMFENPYQSSTITR